MATRAWQSRRIAIACSLVSLATVSCAEIAGLGDKPVVEAGASIADGTPSDTAAVDDAAVEADAHDTFEASDEADAPDTTFDPDALDASDASAEIDVPVADAPEADVFEAAALDGSVPDAASAVGLDEGFPTIVTSVASTDTTLTLSLDVSLDSAGGGKMLVAVVVWGQHSGASVWPVTVDGAGLTWTNQAQTTSEGFDSGAVGVGVWTAWTDAAIVGQSVTATRNNAVDADAVFAIYALSNASQTIGATGTNNGFTSASAPLSFTVDAHAAGSFVVGGFLDGASASGLEGNTLAGTVYDRMLDAASDDSLAVGRLAGDTAASGAVTIGQSEAFSAVIAAGVEIVAR